MTSPQSILIVEGLLAIPFLLIGLSHILQRQLWVDVFANLAAKGTAGVVWRTFLFEMWPATLIVILHQDWSWPGIVITLYGHALMIKIAISLLRPDLGLKSLQQAEKNDDKFFVFAGIFLLAMGLLATVRVLAS